MRPKSSMERDVILLQLISRMQILVFLAVASGSDSPPMFSGHECDCLRGLFMGEPSITGRKINRPVLRPINFNPSFPKRFRDCEKNPCRPGTAEQRFRGG